MPADDFPQDSPWPWWAKLATAVVLAMAFVAWGAARLLERLTPSRELRRAA